MAIQAYGAYGDVKLVYSIYSNWDSGLTVNDWAGAAMSAYTRGMSNIYGNSLVMDGVNTVKSKLVDCGTGGSICGD